MSGTTRPMVAAVVVALALSATPMVALAAVENDTRENAILISDPLPFTDERDTAGATIDASDPHPGCIWEEIPIGATVWYRYTAAEHGDLQAHTFGSDYDTILAVYQVGTDDSLSEIACNDDFFSLESFVTFTVEPGMQLLVMVAEYGQWGAAGNLVLTFAEGTEPPIEPPVYESIEVEITLTGATVSRSSGHVAVHGTISCSTQAFADVWGSVRQRVGRSYIHAGAHAFDACGPEARPLVMTSQYESGVFAGGQLQITLEVFASSDTGGGYAMIEETLRARMAP